MPTLSGITTTILTESSSSDELEVALNAFSAECAYVSDVSPDPSFRASAEDSQLENGLAISPQAAAHCVVDYRRSTAFIRATYSALCCLSEQFPGAPIRVLYAGCGPYATLLLPLLHRFEPGQLDITLLDIHQRSLDSAIALIDHFGELAHDIKIACADACNYQYPGKPQLIISETMQKSLEQEPQFAVTASLAPQLCDGGIFIPQRIDVSLQLMSKKSGVAPAICLGPVLSLRSEKPEAPETIIELPALEAPEEMVAALFTEIHIFGRHRLGAGESELTLPRPCPELAPLRPGATCRLTYRTGPYPWFELTYVES